MCRLLILGAFVLAFEVSFSQNQSKADSLRNILETQTLNDSTKIHVLRRLAYFETDPSQSKEYSEALLKVSSKAGNLNGLYNGYYFLGQAEKLLGNPAKSLDAFLQSLTYAKLLGSKKSLCESYTAIADSYVLNEDFSNALNYYNQAINSYAGFTPVEENEIKTLANAYLNAGDAYFLAGKLDEALVYSEKAGYFYKQIDYSIGLAYDLGNIGLVHAQKGDHDLAEIHIQQAVTILEKLKDYYAISIYYTYMADIYLEKKDLKRALQYAHESLGMAQEYGLKEQIRDANLKLYELHKVAENYAEALRFHEEFSFYKDSITNREVIQKMADQRTEFEVGQKQAEVDLLTAQKKIQQLMLFAAIGFSLIVIILAAIIYKYYRDKNKVARILQLQKAELERVNHTKDKFFSIISHDLRGPVSSFFGISRMIKFLVKSKETDQLLEIADDIDQSVERLSSLLDNLLNWAMQQQGHIPNVPEKLEFRYLAKDLAATFKTMADSKKITLEVEVDETAQIWADRNMTMTIFRNLINNALKFTPENGTVTLFATENEGMVFAGVKDSGVGIPQEKLEKLFTLGEKKSTYGTSGEKGLGLGLQLVYEFIGLNNGEIKVESEPGKGTTFTVKLPSFKSEMSALLVS